jgi:hypothetical protein
MTVKRPEGAPVGTAGQVQRRTTLRGRRAGAPDDLRWQARSSVEDHFTIGFGQIPGERDPPLQHTFRFGVIERVEDAGNVEQRGRSDDWCRSLSLFQGS